MKSGQKAMLLQYGVGIPCVALVLFIASFVIVGVVQSTLDSSNPAVSIFVGIPAIILSFPMMYLVEATPVGGLLKSLVISDNNVLFVSLALDAMFWAALLVYLYRFVSRRKQQKIT